MREPLRCPRPISKAVPFTWLESHKVSRKTSLPRPISLPKANLIIIMMHHTHPDASTPCTKTNSVRGRNILSTYCRKNSPNMTVSSTSCSHLAYGRAVKSSYLGRPLGGRATKTLRPARTNRNCYAHVKLWILARPLEVLLNTSLQVPEPLRPRDPCEQLRLQSGFFHKVSRKASFQVNPLRHQS